MQEAKRLIGGQMLLDGFDIPEVVDALQVVYPTVYQWKKRLETDGFSGGVEGGNFGLHHVLQSNRQANELEMLRPAQKNN